MINLYCLCSILLLSPLISSIILWPLSRIFSNKYISSISILCLTISTSIALYLLWRSCSQDFTTTYIAWYKWGDFGSVQFKFGFLLDQLNIIMLAVITIVSLVVQIYSIRYMQNDSGYVRFFSYMCFFTFSMSFLIIAGNLLQMFFGWELVGLSSYLLINYWFKQELTNLAAFKAFIINRIGDCSFLLGIAAIFSYCGSLDYLTIFQKLPDLPDNINLICGLLFFGAMAKSAQIPLHVWLPDAMEGPTPVSALIHSATMVTAGVFILARMSPVFEKSEYWLNIILLTGTMTALLMGILAVIETDLKKIIAYSTISQLGIMMIAIGISAYNAAIFHLINHAFFKSLLFLAAGSVMLSVEKNNIYELPSGLKKYLPITFWVMLIGTLSIAGFPGFSGFFSKELIISGLQLSYLPFAESAYYILLLITFITAFYSFRMFFLVFYKQTLEATMILAKEAKIISGSLLILAGFSIFSGFLLFWPMISNKLFSNNIIVLPEHDVIKDFYENDFVSILQYFGHGFISKSGLCVFLGIISSTILYVRKPILSGLILDKIKNNFLFFYKILQHQYFFNQFNKLLVMMFKFLCQIFYEIVDKIFIDKMLVNGTANVIVRLSRTVQKVQTGCLYNYIFFMLTGVLIAILWLFLIAH